MTPAEKRKQTIMAKPGGFKAIGQKAKETNLARYGTDFFQKWGAKGGKAGKGPDYKGGFAGDKELAARAGRLGGLISRRPKRPKIVEEVNDVMESGMLG